MGVPQVNGQDGLCGEGGGAVDALETLALRRVVRGHVALEIAKLEET